MISRQVPMTPLRTWQGTLPYSVKMGSLFELAREKARHIHHYLLIAFATSSLHIVQCGRLVIALIPRRQLPSIILDQSAIEAIYLFMSPPPIISLALITFLSHSTTSEAFSSPSSPIANANLFSNRHSHHRNLPRRGSICLADAISIGANGDDINLPAAKIDDHKIINKTNGDTTSYDIANVSEKPPFPLVLWRFTRPHTIIGSAIAIPSIFLLAAPTYQSFFTWRCMASLIYAAVPSLFMNLYITGLNQITDVEIDKINVSIHLFCSPGAYIFLFHSNPLPSYIL